MEHAIHVLVEHKMALSMFDCRYHNDESGCPAYTPKILLNVVLFAYSHGFVGSRRIEWLCRKHVTCMALACLQHPDPSKIASFVSSMPSEMLSLFRDILLVCEEQQLLGGTVFALDGLKLSSNASKQWSGTRDELKHTQEKLEAKIAQLLAEHQQVDAEEQEGSSLSVTPQPERGEDALSPHGETPAEQVQAEDIQASVSEGVEVLSHDSRSHAVQGEAVQTSAAPTEPTKRGDAKGHVSRSRSPKPRKQKRPPHRRKPQKSKKQKRAQRLKR